MSGRKRSPDLKSDHARYEFAKELIQRWAPSIAPASGAGEEPEDGWVSVGLSPVGLQLGEVKLDPLHVSYLGQAAMWYSVARLLAERARIEPDPMEYLFPHFVHLFLFECQAKLLGPTEPSGRRWTENEVIDRLNEMRPRYWSKLPDLRGRPPVGPPSAEAFLPVPHLRERFQSIRSSVVRHYDAKEWATCNPMRRIMKRSRRQAKKDQQAHTRLGEYEHFPLEMLSDAAVLKFAVALLSKRPIDAALELAWIVAREDSSYAGSPSSFQEAWRIYQRWLSGKPLPQKLTE